MKMFAGAEVATMLLVFIGLVALADRGECHDPESHRMRTQAWGVVSALLCPGRCKASQPSICNGRPFYQLRHSGVWGGF
jgi:hypothetical protein